jgi:hypothetical protein
MAKGSNDTAPSCVGPFEATEADGSKLGVNSRIEAGLKTLASASEAVLGGVAPNPRGVKEGAFAACVVNVAFLLAACRPAGVNDGDSTFKALFEPSCWFEVGLFCSWLKVQP